MIYETRMVLSGLFVSEVHIPAIFFSSAECAGACLGKSDVTECMAYHYDKDRHVCSCGQLDYFPANASGPETSIGVNPLCPRSPGMKYVNCVNVWALLPCTQWDKTYESFHLLSLKLTEADNPESIFGTQTFGGSTFVLEI